MSVIIETSIGDITVDLYTNERPRCCLNFLKLCKIKYYNFSLFHTVQQNVIAQTGDPTATGRGGESIFAKIYGDQARFFDMEVVPRIKHEKKGLVSMVNNGSGMHGAQFFFTLADNLDYLDGLHTVFGEVVEGFDILEKLNNTFCGEDNRPHQDIRIYHTIILDDPYNDPSGLEIPAMSPGPTEEMLNSDHIPCDANIDEDKDKTEEELSEMMAEKEAKANTQILEMVGDLPEADVAPPENVLFVCKLNPVTTAEDLEIIFSRFGTIVSCEVIKDSKTGESLQYAFIEFDNPEHCESAYFKMDNVLIDDRRIHVDFSQSVSKLKWKGKGKGVDILPTGDAPIYVLKNQQRQNDGYDLVYEHDERETRDTRKDDKIRKKKASRESDDYGDEDTIHGERKKNHRSSSNSHYTKDKSRDNDRGRDNTLDRKTDGYRYRRDAEDVIKKNKDESHHHDRMKDERRQKDNNDWGKEDRRQRNDNDKGKDGPRYDDRDCRGRKEKKNDNKESDVEDDRKKRKYEADAEVRHDTKKNIGVYHKESKEDNSRKRDYSDDEKRKYYNSDDHGRQKRSVVEVKDRHRNKHEDREDKGTKEKHSRRREVAVDDERIRKYDDGKEDSRQRRVSNDHERHYRSNNQDKAPKDRNARKREIDDSSSSKDSEDGRKKQPAAANKDRQKRDKSREEKLPKGSNSRKRGNSDSDSDQQQKKKQKKKSNKKDTDSDSSIDSYTNRRKSDSVVKKKKKSKKKHKSRSQSTSSSSD